MSTLLTYKVFEHVRNYGEIFSKLSQTSFRGFAIQIRVFPRRLANVGIFNNRLLFSLLFLEIFVGGQSRDGGSLQSLPPPLGKTLQIHLSLGTPDPLLAIFYGQKHSDFMQVHEKIYCCIFYLID